ncbi:MAG: class I SAM-dependent methyltransferase [Cytophagales bacterium]|nr:class I SAM-dependent methyltransferase [Cytophagales bacterium]
MYEKIKVCPVCGSHSFVNYLTCKDHSISQEDFTITQCTHCSFLFTNPRPTTARLPRYYQSQDYISHKDKATNPINLAYKLARHFTLRSKIKLVHKYQHRGHIIDIGCGTGHFLQQARRAGWNTTGVEPDAGARAIASELLGNTIYASLDDLGDHSFNMITLWHVLEHVPDLNSYISTLKKLLTDSGTIFVAVPNHKSYDATHYQEHWAAYDVPRHLYHFDQHTLAKLFEKHQFKIIDTIPMKLDSFYVSLLSEKYLRTGIKGYANSILTGLKSNSYAKKHQLEYSSLIYVIQRK